MHVWYGLKFKKRIKSRRLIDIIQNISDCNVYSFSIRFKYEFSWRAYVGKSRKRGQLSNYKQLVMDIEVFIKHFHIVNKPQLFFTFVVLCLNVFYYYV